MKDAKALVDGKADPNCRHDAKQTASFKRHSRGSFFTLKNFEDMLLVSISDVEFAYLLFLFSIV